MELEKPRTRENVKQVYRKDVIGKLSTEENEVNEKLNVF